MVIEYKTKEELQKLPDLTDKDLNEWYQRLRKANDNFYVSEVKVTFRQPFSWRHPFRSRKETVTKYEVLEHLGGPETRVLCFPEFRTMVDATELKTWMYGFLDGVNLTLEKMEEHHPKPKFSVDDLVKVVDADTMNKRVRRELLHHHGIVIGQTVCRGNVCLKFTLLNPLQSHAKLDELLDLILQLSFK